MLQEPRGERKTAKGEGSEEGWVTESGVGEVGGREREQPKPTWSEEWQRTCGELSVSVSGT